MTILKCSATTCAYNEDMLKHGCGCETIKIDCKACGCTYNDKCKCTAASINVDGNDARKCDETKCSTFQCEY